jgi:hypothetical protein
MIDFRLSHLMTKRAIYPSWFFKKLVKRCDIFWVLYCNNSISAARRSGLNACLVLIVRDSVPIASIAYAKPSCRAD